MFPRPKKKIVKVGPLTIGGGKPIVVQSMATAKTSDVDAVVRQINDLAAVGCQLVRVSILNLDDAAAIARIKPRITIPLCADIHFNYQFALKAIESGADKIRINPGNIGDRERVKEVIRSAKKRKVAIRFGVNSGSLEKHIYSMKARAEGMVKSLTQMIKLCEAEKFHNVVLSIKSSEVHETIEANRLLSKKTKYPIHLGVTATGAGLDAVIKSTAALGTLLAEGVGDTIRVSLTADPREEIKVGTKILQALGLRKYNYEVIACPTCGRTEIDIEGIVHQVEDALAKEYSDKPCPYRKIAVMGCVVNGPGEAKEADIGIAGGKGFGFIIKKGEVLRKVDEKNLVSELLKEIERR